MIQGPSKDQPLYKQEIPTCITEVVGCTPSDPATLLSSKPKALQRNGEGGHASPLLNLVFCHLGGLLPGALDGSGPLMWEGGGVGDGGDGGDMVGMVGGDGGDVGMGMGTISTICIPVRLS